MIVPRRGVAAQPPSALVRAVISASAILVVLAAWKSGALLPARNGMPRDPAEFVIAAADMLALLAVLAHGLERARRPPLECALWIALLAISLAFGTLAAPDRASSRIAMCFGAGVAFAIPWFRRADRRAAALAALAFGGAGLFSAFGALLGAAGAAWMCASTAAPSRKRVVVWSGSALAACVAIGAAAALRSASVSVRALAAPIARPFLASACIAAVASMSALRRSSNRPNAPRATALTDHSGESA